MATLMTNREKLLQMYDYAIMQGKCKNRKSFAELIGISDKNLSNALSTNEKIADRFCTNGLLNKANAALNYSFAQQWLQDGTGEMYAQNNNVPAPAPAPTQAPARVQALGTKPSFDDDDIEYLRHRIKELEYVIELQRHRIEQLEYVAKKGNVSARAN
jgi:hypothetical protein